MEQKSKLTKSQGKSVFIKQKAHHKVDKLLNVHYFDKLIADDKIFGEILEDYQERWWSSTVHRDGTHTF